MILHKETICNLGLESGDIFAVKGSGPLHWACSNLIEPTTDRVHFGLIWMPTDNSLDRVILESQGEGTILETLLDIVLHLITKKGTVGKAVCIGRLSFYDGKDVEFYRPTQLLKKVRRQAPAALSAYGRDSYGYDYISKLILRSLKLWLSTGRKEGHFRRLHVEEIPAVEPGKALICTVVPDVGYQLIGADLIPPGMTATPNAYARLIQRGLLTKIEPTYK
jgi:hypothetical protein